MAERELKDVVKEKYGQAALKVMSGEKASCCGGAASAPAERELKDVVKEKYGQAALRVTGGQGSSCCGTASSRGGADPITSNLYGCGETAELPAEAVAASLGCGNPTALAELH